MDEMIKPTKEAGTSSGTTQQAANAAKQKIAEHANAGLSAYEQLQSYHKETLAADRAAKEKADRQILTDEEMSQVPEEHRAHIDEIYNQLLGGMFQAEGVKVTPKDKEWLEVQAELEDPTTTVARVLLAAHEAAGRKKQRVQGMSRNDAWSQAYKK